MLLHLIQQCRVELFRTVQMWSEVDPGKVFLLVLFCFVLFLVLFCFVFLVGAGGGGGGILQMLHTSIEAQCSQETVPCPM